MTVSKSSLSGLRSSQTLSLAELIEIDEAAQTLTIQLGKTQWENDALFALCREEIARVTCESQIKEIVFDLSRMLVLPSSALGLIAAVSQGEAKVRVRNPSASAHEDFQMTGLYQMIDLDPVRELPPK